ncbi:hypothetical protein HYD_6590 [Candidatus Hydrogenosomobacter endosymbioticus]|uniref:Uncharacterized protein n=2 Tax=Candidatus Hydrogenosomobacter endosymbioticus TaxID=2558174 RepID=A0ABN6L7Q4_9PROT|nr:hypothetical protein HYD_6590 [Candidatus Hydrogenosomobacter endosymbioticus]
MESILMYTALRTHMGTLSHFIAKFIDKIFTIAEGGSITTDIIVVIQIINSIEGTHFMDILFTQEGIWGDSEGRDRLLFTVLSRLLKLDGNYGFISDALFSLVVNTIVTIRSI